MNGSFDSVSALRTSSVTVAGTAPRPKERRPQRLAGRSRPRRRSRTPTCTRDRARGNRARAAHGPSGAGPRRGARRGSSRRRRSRWGRSRVASRGRRSPPSALPDSGARTLRFVPAPTRWRSEVERVRPRAGVKSSRGLGREAQRWAAHLTRGPRSMVFAKPSVLCRGCGRGKSPRITRQLVAPGSDLRLRRLFFRSRGSLAPEPRVTSSPKSLPRRAPDSVS